MMYPRRQDAAVLPDDCSFHPVIGWPAVQFGIATSRACSVAIPLLIRAGTGATGWNMPPEMHRGATFRSLMCRRRGVSIVYQCCYWLEETPRAIWT